MAPDKVQLLLAAGERQTFAANEALLEQGQVGTHIYIIQSGRVSVVKTVTGGTEVKLAELGVGECLGEMSLLSGEPCNASVRALEETVAVGIPGEQLDGVMAGNPKLHRAFSKLFMARLKATNVKLEEELARGMTGRLSMISLLEIIQTLMMSRQTGTLTVKRGDGEGFLYLKDGQVHTAETGELLNEEAFKDMAVWSDGSFSFLPHERPDIPKEIQHDTMHLMMEAARGMDEGEAAAAAG